MKDHDWTPEENRVYDEVLATLMGAGDELGNGVLIAIAASIVSHLVDGSEGELTCAPIFTIIEGLVNGDSGEMVYPQAP